MEMGGYAARIGSHKRPFLVSTFVAQYFLIVVVCPRTITRIMLTVKAPVLFTAAIYLSLSMAVKGFAAGESILVIRPKLVLICEYALAKGSYRAKDSLHLCRCGDQWVPS